MRQHSILGQLDRKTDCTGIKPATAQVEPQRAEEFEIAVDKLILFLATCLIDDIQSLAQSDLQTTRGHRMCALSLK